MDKSSQPSETSDYSCSKLPIIELDRLDFRIGDKITQTKISHAIDAGGFVWHYKGWHRFVPATTLRVIYETWKDWQKLLKLHPNTTVPSEVGKVCFLIHASPIKPLKTGIFVENESPPPPH